MLCDFHIHTDFSGDSSTKPKLQVERAIAMGMDILCLTDHMDIGQIAEGGKPMEFSVPEYQTAMERLKQQYKDRIQVRMGMELGLEPKYKEAIQMASKSASFDYILGSIHIIDGMDPYYPEYFQKYQGEKAYRRYFDCCLENARLFDCFDCFGHIDYILRYGSFVPENYPDSYMDQIEPLLKLLIEKGKGIECNTAGMRKKIGFPNPHPRIIKRYLELGGEILCVGSDAHSPKDLGGHFPEAERMLKQCGARYYTVFKDRKPEFIPL